PSCDLDLDHIVLGPGHHRFGAGGPVPLESHPALCGVAPAALEDHLAHSVAQDADRHAGLVHLPSLSEASRQSHPVTPHPACGTRPAGSSAGLASCAHDPGSSCWPNRPHGLMIDWGIIWRDYIGISWNGALGVDASAVVLYIFLSLLVHLSGQRLMANPTVGSFVVLALIGGVTARATLGESPTLLGALIVLN